MQRLIYLAAAFIAVLTLVQPVQAREPFTLDAVRAQVQRDYASVAQISGERLKDTLREGDVLLLDVREKDEFSVSRIPGAQRVDPDTWTSTFLKGFKDKARGKTVVFYCSVGVRSSRLAASVQTGLKESGARAVYNLDGGVFAWHNAKRPLVNANGPTDYVHPFDSHWGTLVERQAKTRTTP